jgi:hypothetical protein
MSYADALERITQIQQQIEQLTGAGAASSSSATTSTGASTGTDATDSSDFANALTQAQGSPPTDATDASSASDPVAADLVSSTAATGGTPLPSGASPLLTSDQQIFASQLSADTGLNPGVVSAWMLAEESGDAAQSRQSAGNNDWLNVGYTDGSVSGAGDAVWSDPVSAANATAGWLKGQATVSGYGTASASIQGILESVGQTPQSQIAALQSSGWASSGYPNLSSLYAEVTG